jgi:hypothetical protein
MNFDQAKLEIEQWIVDFVEKPTPLLNGWAPCPYARQARLSKKVEIRPGCYNPVDDLRHMLMNEFDVVAYVYDRERWPADEFNQLVYTANLVYLSSQGLIALADHPDDQETVNGVVMNQGTYAIVFVQDLAKLNHFAKILGSRKFYNGWDEEYLKVLFLGREDPRI